MNTLISNEKLLLGFLKPDLNSPEIDEKISSLNKSGCKVCIVDMDWALLEPREGDFNSNVINDYKNILKKIVDFGIKPIVSLQNNSFPSWFENIGSFLNDKSIVFFERYTEYVVRNLSENVSHWITFNDVNLGLLNKYLKNKSKSSVKNRDFFIELNNIILSHIKSYGKIYEISLNYDKKEVNVGFSLNLPFFNSKKTFIDKISLKKANQYFYEAFLIGMGEGRAINKNLRDFRNCKTLFFDFLAINYYNFYKVNFSLTQLVNAEPISENLRENFENVGELLDKRLKKIPRPIIFIESRRRDSLTGCLNARVITPDLND